MNQLKAVHDVSGFYFFLIAFLYVFSAIALKNQFYGQFALLFMRIFDVPAVGIALLYGGTSLAMQVKPIQDEEASPWSVIIFVTCMILFGLTVFINFAFPSVL